MLSTFFLSLFFTMLAACNILTPDNSSKNNDKSGEQTDPTNSSDPLETDKEIDTNKDSDQIKNNQINLPLMEALERETDSSNYASIFMKLFENDVPTIDTMLEKKDNKGHDSIYYLKTMVDSGLVTKELYEKMLEKKQPGNKVEELLNAITSYFIDNIRTTKSFQEYNKFTKEHHFYMLKEISGKNEYSYIPEYTDEEKLKYRQISVKLFDDNPAQLKVYKDIWAINNGDKETLKSNYTLVSHLIENFEGKVSSLNEYIIAKINAEAAFPEAVLKARKYRDDIYEEVEKRYQAKLLTLDLAFRTGKPATELKEQYQKEVLQEKADAIISSFDKELETLEEVLDASNVSKIKESLEVTYTFMRDGLLSKMSNHKIKENELEKLATYYNSIAKSIKTTPIGQTLLNEYNKASYEYLRLFLQIAELVN